MSKPVRLVFVCVENSCRSQMAEALARMAAPKSVEVFSAGSSASGVVNPGAIQAMKALGYDLSTHRSTRPEDLPPGPFDVVVSMGCGDRCPALPTARRIEWEIDDPKAMGPDGFVRVRDEIREKVRALLQELGVETTGS